MINGLVIICGAIALFVFGVEIGISIGIRRVGKINELVKTLKKWGNKKS